MNRKGSGLQTVVSLILIATFAFLIMGGSIIYQTANGSTQLQNSAALNSTYGNLTAVYSNTFTQGNESFAAYSSDPGAQSTSILGGTSVTFSTIPKFFKFIGSGIVGLYNVTLGFIYAQLKIPVILQWTITLLLMSAIIFGVWTAIRIGLTS